VIDIEELLRLLVGARAALTGEPCSVYIALDLLDQAVDLLET